MIVVDTDVLIEIFDKKSKRGEEALGIIEDSGERMVTTAVNLHEILYGIRKRGKPAEEVLQLPVLDYMKSDASLSAELELKAEKKGTPVRKPDAMIAAIAMNNGARLYTLNVKHFKPLEALGLELFR
jgi:predicted nucleic acid-binding protein